MLKKLMILPIAAGFLAVNAGAAVSDNYAPGEGGNDSKCYWISTVDDLDAFAAMVGNDQDLAFSNGAFNKAFTPSTACAKLLQDIKYNGDTKVLNANGSGLNGNKAPSKKWSPIMFYGGTFDGNGKTIYGLYANQDWEPSFIRKAVGGAEVKNLKIEDSYFRTANNGAGGIIGDVAYTLPEFNDKTVLINGCAFVGYLYSGRGNTGGLVGGVGDGMALSVANSYANPYFGGSRTDRYSLVGYVNNQTYIDVLNCAYVGTTSPYNETRTDAIENVGKQNDTTACRNYINDYLVKNADSPKQLAMKSVEELKEEDGIEGLDFELEKDGSGNVVVKAVVGALSDTGAVIISKDITVDRVTFSRSFIKDAMSSIVLPFSISTSNVANTKFYEFVGVVKEDAEGNPLEQWSVGMNEVSGQLEAHHPYFLQKTDAGGVLTFNGGVTLLTTREQTLENRQGDWALQGVYSYKKWEEGDSELGKVYGQAASTKEGSYNADDFVKLGKNSQIKSMRAYLVNRPSILAKRAAVMSAEEIVALPKVIPYVILGSINNPVPEEGAEQGEETLGIVNSIKAPAMMLKADRWFDPKGRRMNGKPNSQGAFIKNGTPVIVK